MWIEIKIEAICYYCYQSLPLRECGLKFLVVCLVCLILVVTPLAGVWIEIRLHLWGNPTFTVTPLAGVWIEI